MISSVQFQSRKKTTTNQMEIASPSRDSGAITIICGRNHSGKSYLLRRVQRNIATWNDLLKAGRRNGSSQVSTDDISCTFTANDQPLSSVYISNIINIAKLTKGTSIIQESNHKNRRFVSKRAENFNQIQVKECLEELALDCLLAYHTNYKLDFDVTSWNDPKNIEYRSAVLQKLSTDQLFNAPRKLEIIHLFEKLTNGKLYFGIARPEKNLPIFEFFLVFADDIVIPLANWSEGQKVLFTLFILLHYKKPEILIFDEIENHLHPEFISIVLKYIKEHVSQSIISTHHPHIVFSRYVDKVHFLELKKPPSDLEDIIEYDRQRSKSPTRSVQPLDKTYAKLVSTYKLFDSYDNLLLRLSSSNLENLNELLVNTFTRLFFYEVVPPDELKNPDLQSQKLYELFEGRMHEKTIKVLEIGAGDGRLLIDVSKILRTSENERIKWCLYEPNDQHREKIVQTVGKSSYKELITIVGNLPEDKFDFIVIANVLHELTPEQIASILAYSQRALLENGKVVIIELFPLLNPEKYAVPLNSDEWLRLARLLGFNGVDESINFRNASVNAYFIELTLTKGGNKTKDDMETIISEFWNNEVSASRVANYAGQIHLDRSEQIPRIIGNLTTLASILARKQGLWY